MSLSNIKEFNLLKEKEYRYSKIRYKTTLLISFFSLIMVIFIFYICFNVK